MRLLFAIVNWNNEQDSLACVGSLLSDMPSSSLILLIDNASENVEALEKYDGNDQVLLLKNEKNVGFTAASNQAFQYAIQEHYDYVIFINNDAVVADGFHTSLTDILNSNKVDILSMQIRQYEDRSRLDNVGHMFLNTGEIVPIAFDARADDHQEPMTNIASCAAGTVYSRAMIQDIGHYDEFFSTGYEDAEYGLRAFIAGYPTHYFPALKIYHKISQSVSKVDDLAYRVDQQVNIYYSYFKLTPIPVMILNMPFILLKYMLVLIVEFFSLRWHYIKIHFLTFVKLWNSRHDINEARKRFYNNRKVISSLKLIRHQKFFLWFDIKRFYKHLVRSEKTVFDRSLKLEE